MLHPIRIVTPLLKSNMYVLIQKGHAVFIDCAISQSLYERMREKNIMLDYILPTHEHYDHISGINWWKERFPQAVVLTSGHCHSGMQSIRLNCSIHFDAYCEIQTWILLDEPVESSEYTCRADQTFEGKTELVWQGHRFLLSEMPGHSRGGCAILADDNYFFCGDTLFREIETQTRFAGGSLREFQEVTMPFLRALAPGLKTFPGHFEPFLLGEALQLK